MLIRRLAVLSATTACVAASSAAASTFLRVDPSGSALSAGSTIRSGGTGDRTVLTFASGAITCSTSAFSATVGASGGATVTGTLDSLTFTGCADTLPIVTVNGCHQAASSPITVTAGELVVDHLLIKCPVGFIPASCYFAAPAATAAVTNVGSTTLTFAGVNITHSPPGVSDDAGPKVCPPSGTLSTTLTQVTAGTGTRVTVTTS